MKTSTTSNFFKIIYLLCSISAFFFATATKAVAHPVILDAQSDYDSDSEDEEDYEYPGIKPLEIPEKTDQYCLSLFRGIHFSPSIFNKSQRSKMRKKREIGSPVYCSAAFDQAKIEPSNEKINHLTLGRIAQTIRNKIKRLPKQKRDEFQQLYTNLYDKFHSLVKPVYGFLSSKNPQVSASETPRHSEKYAYGLKFLGKNIEMLTPDYDDNGKPHHPYLGKLYVILIGISNLEELDPYFVVHGHANKDIKIFTHFSNSILIEREVSIPGLIEGKYVVCEMNAKMPSFTGKYKEYYQQKYGLNKRSYTLAKNKLNKKEALKRLTKKGILPEKREETWKKKKTTALKNLTMKIIEHQSKELKKHVQQACEKSGKQIVYKNLTDNNFIAQLPDIETAKRLALT